jgi:hypothetical protein
MKIDDNKTDQAVIEYLKFKQNHPDLFKEHINGAGPQKFGNWVRDKWFFGFSVTLGANVHDYLYSKYADETEFSREDADNIFLKLMKQNLSQHNWYSKLVNTPIIYSYWSAVRMFGGSFWKK